MLAPEFTTVTFAAAPRKTHMPPPFTVVEVADPALETIMLPPE